MVRVGIVGTGYTIGIAKSHIQAYKRVPDARITAIYDIIPGRAQDYIKTMELPDARACRSFEELLGEVDAVSICTPNSTHIELAVQALKAGKHVLCEKPFATSAQACEEALKYAELSQRVCMIGLCYRGIPGFIYLKKLIDEGALGEIFYVRQSQGGNRIADPRVKLEWRMQQALSGPGAIADFGSHMLDISDMMLRDQYGKITEVQCMEGTFIPERASIGSGKPDKVSNGDVAIFNARTEKGVLISFTASRIGCSHTLEVYGSGGYASFNGADPFVLTIQEKDPDAGYLGPRKVVDVPEELYMWDENTPKIPFEINFYHEIKQFVSAIENGTPVDTDFSRGLYIQRLIDAIQLSADSGETIKIDF